MKNLHLIPLASLVEPDFDTMRDDSIVGLQHERRYHIGKCDSDGFVRVYACAYSWREVLQQAIDFLASGCHHVLIEAMEIAGQGYFQPMRKIHFTARVTR